MINHSEVLIVNKNISFNKKFSSRHSLDRFLTKNKDDDFSLSDAFFSNTSSEAAEYIIDRDPDIVGFLGGDGTMSSTLNDILKKDSSFLEDKFIRIIPNGTGNDKARQLHEYKHKYDYLNKSSPLFNLGLVTDDYLLATINDEHQRYVFNVGGIGLDSQTLIEFENLRNKNFFNPSKYIYSAMSAINKLNGSKGRMDYVMNDEISGSSEGSSDAVMFLFMLGKYFGGGMPINKKVKMDDGFFESVFLKRGTNFNLGSSLLSLALLKKDQYKNPLTEYLSLGNNLNLSVHNGDKFYFESDGDLLKDNLGLVKVKSLDVRVAGKINYLVN